MTGKNAMPQGSATAQTSAQNALDDLCFARKPAGAGLIEATLPNARPGSTAPLVRSRARPGPARLVGTPAPCSASRRRERARSSRPRSCSPRPARRAPRSPAIGRGSSLLVQSRH